MRQFVWTPGWGSLGHTSISTNWRCACRVWRELRRLKIGSYEDGDIIEQAAAAADKGSWGKFTMLMGGFAMLNKDRPIKLYKEYMDSTNAYGEPRAKATQGVYAVATGELLYSRHHVWEMKSNKLETLIKRDCRILLFKKIRTATQYH